MPHGSIASGPGYKFHTEAERRASYFTAMSIAGLLDEDGLELSMERYYDSSFFMPFKLSSELPNYGPELAEKILQEPIVPNGRYTLFLEFPEVTTFVIRVSVIYRQAQVLAINSERQTFKSFDIGKFNLVYAISAYSATELNTKEEITERCTTSTYLTLSRPGFSKSKI